MSYRAFVIASNLVEIGLHLRTESAHEADGANLHDWIAQVSAGSGHYIAAKTQFDDLTATDSDANTEGHKMAFEYGRAAYELGVQVGLRLRRAGDH